MLEGGAEDLGRAAAEPAVEDRRVDGPEVDVGDGAAVLAQVINLYPKTEPAALAAKRLETP